MEWNIDQVLILNVCGIISQYIERLIDRFITKRQPITVGDEVVSCVYTNIFLVFILINENYDFRTVSIKYFKHNV